jgi:magnesium transporter
MNMQPDERLALDFMKAHPNGAARLLERSQPDQAAAVLNDAPAGVAAGVLRLMSPPALAGCAAAMPVDRLAAVVAELPLDAAAAVMHRLLPERRDAVLTRLPAAAEASLRQMLAYGPYTAGALADPLALALPEDLTVAEAQRRLRVRGEHLRYYIYVVARDQRLVGVLGLPELMAARPKETLATAMRRDPIRLEASTAFATLAAHPAWQNLDVLPVVDAESRLVGAIRHMTVRRLEAELGLRARNESVLGTLVGLSELYWAGLAGMFPRVAAAVLSPDAPSPEPARPGEVPDAR